MNQSLHFLDLWDTNSYTEDLENITTRNVCSLLLNTGVCGAGEGGGEGWALWLSGVICELLVEENLLKSMGCEQKRSTSRYCSTMQFLVEIVYLEEDSFSNKTLIQKHTSNIVKQYLDNKVTVGVLQVL